MAQPSLILLYRICQVYLDFSQVFSLINTEVVYHQIGLGLPKKFLFLSQCSNIWNQDGTDANQTPASCLNLLLWPYSCGCYKWDAGTCCCFHWQDWYSPVTLRHLKDIKKRDKNFRGWSSVSHVFKQPTLNIVSQNWMCSRTCEVDGLYGLDKFRLLDLKPLQQLCYETHDIHLRRRKDWVTTVKILKGDHPLWPLKSRIAVTFSTAVCTNSYFGIEQKVLWLVCML